jgi:formate dehydrogenase iron-sulfur subunit
MTSLVDLLTGDGDPASLDGYADHPPRMGFFTDTSVCIGCKACEVACKEWNHVPEDGLNLTGMSYDNTIGLGADTWRHVAFIEQQQPADGDVRWLMSSDVCKHCTHAACLDVCPTGALFRTEFGTVVVQEDICNGCGYCIPACPYGVIDQRKGDGRAWKCTLCYDRIGAGLEPACAKACPTDSIQGGPARYPSGPPGGAGERHEPPLGETAAWRTANGAVGRVHLLLRQAGRQRAGLEGAR